MEDQSWSARDRTVNARMEQYPEESDSMKVKVEELESLLWSRGLGGRFQANLVKPQKGKPVGNESSQGQERGFL